MEWYNKSNAVAQIKMKKKKKKEKKLYPNVALISRLCETDCPSESKPDGTNMWHGFPSQKQTARL